MSRTSRASCEMMNDIRPGPSKSHSDALPAKTRRTPTLQTVLIFSCSSGSNMRGGWPARLASEVGTPLKKKRRSMSARRDVIWEKRGRRTIFGVIRPGYVIRHDPCGRKRIYRAQRARETKVGKWIERAICREGQMISVMVERVSGLRTYFSK